MKKLGFTLVFACICFVGFSQDLTKSCNNSIVSFLKEWQTLIAAIIVMIGWFVNSKLNRNAEIVRRRSEHRLSALKYVIDSVLFEISKGPDKFFNKPESKENLEKARATIQMYGYRNEINIYEKFIAALNMLDNDETLKNKKLDEINKCIPKLTMILESLRTELGLENYKKS
jgi:hypothetical protein